MNECEDCDSMWCRDRGCQAPIKQNQEQKTLVTRPNLFTVACSYGATGEGQTYMVLFTFALNKAMALQKFSEEFNTYYAQGATVYDGYYFDFEGAPFLITDALRKAMEEWPECYMEYKASFSFNFS